MTVPLAEHRAAHLREHRLARGSGTGARWWASTEMPKNSVPRMNAIHTSVVGRVLRLGPPERGHAVGDRLDAGERDRARREALEEEEEAERAAGLRSPVERLRVERRRGCRGRRRSVR